MKLYIIEAVAILTLTSFAISCSDKGFIRELNDIESYINECPDSAMTILDSISALGIKGSEAKAKFALIYSMAQDNNMIEETDDSIINIAVDWYSKHGTDEDRLK